ncbi:hypothetical protein DMC30DRAFT_347309 [Rhodotorula diobovata]|uniref:BTB domain-containing protein n=1 Tax=Rhodotorula diobovata TaxID=5288 RepID=A0A5C5G653_9BASI|nr:hypothetical protein DMC30DRAFT_347309 [Rhodotorula diobovata]
MAQASPDPPSQGPEASSSERQWLSDLRSLLDDARRRFGDVAWSDDDSGRTVYAHKCIVYARATGSFQQRYLGVPHGLSESDLSIYGPSTTSFRTFTPSSTAHRDSLTPTAHSLGRSPRPSSSTCHQSEGESANGNETQALSLGTTDIGVFEAALEYFYTASSQSEAFVVALDGFADGANEEEQGLKGVARLRQDLLYCWRSKLYADVSIVLEGVPGEPFAAHRAILASRSPYFHSLLFGNYSDSDADVFTLPSPPFTPASTTFVLGYLYTGTLDFSPRKFDLATSFEIWRCAAFLSLATLQSAIEAKALAQLNLARAPRILAFAHAPDVSSVRLAAAATPLVVEQFDTAWTATPHVGHLAYDVQKELVRRVCDRVQPARVADAASRVARARRQLEPERAPWTEHVRGMLDGVEEALLGALAQSLPEVVASRGFVDLIEGVGFSTDVLEWLLTLVVKGLREAKAPRAYQALVGSVLLRESPLTADQLTLSQARVLVDDTRSGILSYIKRKWANIRNAGGFDDLEPWCLKELADGAPSMSASASATGAAGSATVRAAPRATRPPLVPAAGTSRRSAAPRPAPSPTPGLPGTSLLSGIPCIVTVRAGGPGGGKALRIKAQVRYIGGLVDEAGEWVGVEALESAIPPEAEGLEWGDGSRGEGKSPVSLLSDRGAWIDWREHLAAQCRTSNSRRRHPRPTRCPQRALPLPHCDRLRAVRRAGRRRRAVSARGDPARASLSALTRCV